MNLVLSFVFSLPVSMTTLGLLGQAFDLSQPSGKLFLIYFLFTTCIGACIGSFLNVVVYRMPLGQSLIHPPSTCPVCKSRLAWYDNVPILGWFWLRGKCRYCKTPISIQYPAVEAFTALLFAAFFVACYLFPHLRSDFPVGLSGLQDTWPAFAVYAILLAALISSTLIDARFFIIPPSIPYFAMFAAILIWPIASFFLPALSMPSSPLPMSGNVGAGIALGGLIGIGLGILLVHLKIIKFDYEEVPSESSESSEPIQKQTAKKTLAEEKNADQPNHAETESAETQAPIIGILVGAFLLGLVIGGTVGFLTHWIFGLILFGVIFIYGLIFIPQSTEGLEEPDWQPLRHPRKAASKEALFLACPMIGMILGGVLLGKVLPPVSDGPGQSEGLIPLPVNSRQQKKIITSGGDGLLADIHQGSTTQVKTETKEVDTNFFRDLSQPVSMLAPRKWYHILGGSFCGFLMGAGLVWGLRVLGTLAFGKEAMGLGDMHLLGAIGAVIGPYDTLLVFFIAPFLGLVYTLLTRGMSQVLKVRFQEVPYGPHLCMATLIMIFAKDPIRTAVYSWVYG